MPQSAPNQNPRFLWQGLLILLPVVLLAAVGFLSLRQDRLLVEAEATQRAQSIAADLATLLRSKLDALAKSAEQQQRGFRLDDAGHLLFPPPSEPVPSPCPFETARLTPDQARLWSNAQGTTLAKPDPNLAVAAWQRFLDSKPPSNFAAQAEYTLALALISSGAKTEAAQHFRSVSETYPNDVGETGLPLQPLARLKLFELATAPSAALPLLESLCSNLVYRPTLLTPQLLAKTWDLAKTTDTKGAVSRWQALWKNHELSRECFEVAQHQSLLPNDGKWNAFWISDSLSLDPGFGVPASAGGFPPSPAYPNFAPVPLSGRVRGIPPLWISNEQTLPTKHTAHTFPSTYLALPLASQSSNCWFSCLDESDLGKAYLETMPLQSRAQPFAYACELEGRFLSEADMAPLPAEPARPSEFARMKLLASASAGNSDQGQVICHAYLADPVALFHQQHVRTLWFSALIAASAIAALVGFLAAYRSFRRQLRLNELKSNFVSSVSHELRAPIASVRLMAESLERGKISDPPKQREYFTFIVQECRRLSALIENVLDFSRIEQGRKQYDFEPTDLVALAEKTVALMQTYAAERQVQVRLALNLPSAPRPQLVADGKALQQALVNLIDNALKHSPKGETIAVGLETRDHPVSEPEFGTVAVDKAGTPHRGVRRTSANAANAPASSPPAGHVLLLWVEDRGPGIPAQEHQKIFERFYRLGSELRRETAGVGVGLSIVKHVVEAHNGRVLVRSSPGHGSRFTLELWNAS